jgi:hypothetical protein
MAAFIDDLFDESTVLTDAATVIRDQAAEIERLREALRSIRDLPECDQDDAHAARSIAHGILGKETQA